MSRVPSENDGAQLEERGRRALRVWPSGADLKPLQAAVVRSDGGERCGNVGTRFDATKAFTKHLYGMQMIRKHLVPLRVILAID